MLDNYQISQKNIYNNLLNSINKNRISHAYLIENSNIIDGLEFALAVSKFLLCPHHFTNNSKCQNCNICEQIDSNDFIEFEIIRPDGKNIKKEQIIKLQENFRYKPVVGNKKIYIIEKAELLNDESANSLLKFLEEPSECITAILVTTNIYQIHETIRSRCQILTMVSNSNSELSSIDKLASYLFESEEEMVSFLENNPSEKLENIIDYINYLEKNKTKTIVFKNKIISNMLNDNISIFIFFKLMIIYYKDLLNYLLNEKVDYFNDYIDNIKEIVNENSKESIVKKINIIIDLSVKSGYNANTNLLLDKLVILISEV